MQQVWAKKLVRNREWTNEFEKDSGYWMLSKTEDGVWIGFLTANTEYILRKMESRAVELQNDNDLRVSDLYCRSNNMRPFPLLTAEEIKWIDGYNSGKIFAKFSEGL